MRAPCSIGGCERTSAGRGWCQMHWRRWRKYGDPNMVQVPGSWVPPKKPCAVDDCEKMAHAHGYCHRHLRRWQKHGDPSVVGERLGRPLKGDKPSIHAVHKRLKRQRGRASEYRCVDCEDPAREWSYDNLDPNELHGTAGGFVMAYSLDLAHYVPRCSSCHRKFDNAHRRADGGNPVGAHITINTLDERRTE